jgi:radical SAM/SPASM domain protein of ACGX system
MTIEKLKCLHKAGIRTAIMTTVSGVNAEELPGIIDLVVENKVNVFAFARYVPTSFEKSTHLTPDQYRNLLEVCWQKFEQYRDSDTSFNLKDHLWTLYLHEKGLFKIPENIKEDVIYEGCNCSNCHLTILPKGEVYACRRFESNIGNVFSDNLHAYRDFDKFEKCNSCELKRFCRGCPAVTYGYTGNFYGADPQCWKQIAS